MAKLSFEEEDLANPSYADLSPFERSTLSDWIEKFKYCRTLIKSY
jgi:DNA replication protein DnaD